MAFSTDFSSPQSSLQLYAVASVYVNGSLLAEEVSINITRESNSESIDTVALGYAGEVLGSLRAEVTVESAVPAVGFELDPGRFMGVMQEISFSLFVGNSTMTFKGFIVSDNFSHAVNGPASLSFKAKGTFIDRWQYMPPAAEL